MATPAPFKYHIERFWDDEFKNIQYIQEPFNDPDTVARWISQGYQSKICGELADMRHDLPSWSGKFFEIYQQWGWKDIGIAFYRMSTGTVMPVHSDLYKRYIELFDLQGKETTIRRALLLLEDWKPGHYLEVAGKPYVNWRAGDVVEWAYNEPHMAANIGLEDKIYITDYRLGMIKSYDEWSPLKKIIVGDATHANWPTMDPVFSKESEKTTWKETPVPCGPVPQRIIDEANEDLDSLATTLMSLGVEVVRPDPLNFQVHDGMYNYCPRDRLLVYGNTIVNPAMMYPCRDMELQCYHDVVDAAEHYYFMPRNEGMILDAANVCRLGDKMLFLESSSGNRAAYEWLCSVFPDVTIELCNFYAGVHIDSTIVPLREGLVMLNASRVSFETVPRVFDGWQKIWVNDVVAQRFHEYPYASKWIAMNMLVVDPHTVICDKHQIELIKTLESYKFTVIPMELRRSRTLGGGFHCVTLDLERG